MRTTEVDLKDFGGSMLVRELKASEVIEFTKKQASDPTLAAYFLITTATVNEDGSPVFCASDKLADLPYAATEKLIDASLQISGLKDDAKKKPSSVNS
jgi:hypothetical protein